MVDELRKAVKLFNRWQFEEAHAAFRKLADAADGRDREFLEGLGYLATAFNRIWHKGGEPNAMVSYLQKAHDTLGTFEGVVLGVDTTGLADFLLVCVEEAKRWRKGELEVYNRDAIPRLDLAPRS